jgi:hypothetical protein
MVGFGIGTLDVLNTRAKSGTQRQSSMTDSRKLMTSDMDHMLDPARRPSQNPDALRKSGEKFSIVFAIVICTALDSFN